MKVKLVGPDLSHWNKIISYAEINKKFDFVMLKYGGEEIMEGTINEDETFHSRYKQFTNLGMPIGCYFFITQKLDIIKRGPEKIANMFADEIAGYRFEMPVALDVEGHKNIPKSILTDYVYRFCEILESRGHYVVIYGSDLSTFKSTLEIDRLKRFDKWVARYGKDIEYVKDWGMWQSSKTYTDPSIKGKFDMNIARRNYPEIIRRMKERKK